MESKPLLPKVACGHSYPDENEQGNILIIFLLPKLNIMMVKIISGFLLAICTLVIGMVYMA